ncbi:hypothetical protein XAP6164_5560002 [Xanthomonas phaseoli pv. phaseoli]|nr:hypothetical protein XAP6164_5560002 [Xanthomonas phaseoli pv. phaseoli]
MRRVRQGRPTLHLKALPCQSFAEPPGQELGILMGARALPMTATKVHTGLVTPGNGRGCA